MREDFCEVCNSKLFKKYGNYGPHEAMLWCPKCKFKGWARKPNKDKEGKTILKRIGNRTAIDKVLAFHGFKKEFCFFCLRKKFELGVKETLTIDHIKELDKGGEDKVENCQVFCTACHKLKNLIRLYFNWHFREKEAKEDDTKTT